MMYIRRKVFSILDTEIGERLFSTTDYILDQREFTGETKRRNKALKRQWLEKLGQERMERNNNDPHSLATEVDKEFKSTRDRIGTKSGQKGAGDVMLGRLESDRIQKGDYLDWKEHFKKDYPDEFKADREAVKFKKMGKANPNPEVVVSPTTPNPVMSGSKAAAAVHSPGPVVSNSKPVIKTESKLSKLAKNKYAQAGAGLLALGGIGYGVHRYIKNKNKGEEDQLENNSND